MQFQLLWSGSTDNRCVYFTSFTRIYRNPVIFCECDFAIWFFALRECVRLWWKADSETSFFYLLRFEFNSITLSTTETCVKLLKWLLTTTYQFRHLWCKEKRTERRTFFLRKMLHLAIAQRWEGDEIASSVSNRDWCRVTEKEENK